MQARARLRSVAAFTMTVVCGCAASDPSGDACLNAPVLRAPESGCLSVGIEVAGEDSCSLGGQLHTGSWVRLVHAADRAAHMEVRLLSSPSTCQVDGSGCAFADLAPGSGEPCGCALGVVQSLPVEGAPTGVSFPLDSPENDLLLRPSGAVFQVSICADDRDAFPTCGRDGLCVSSATMTAGACACLPPCTTDADCPQPRTGTVRPHCEAIGCTLPCLPEDACPDGQVCTAGPVEGPICMTPP